MLTECLVCTKADGTKDYLKDDTLADLIHALPSGLKVLTVVDACHSGTPTDLDTRDYGSRQVMHIGAVSDTQVASDVHDGGALTGAILESIGTRVEQVNAGRSLEPPSVTDVYNWCVNRYGALRPPRSHHSMRLARVRCWRIGSTVVTVRPGDYSLTPALGP